MRTIFTFIAILGCISSSGQDISGKWDGNFSSTFLTSTQSLEVDIEIYNDTLIRGKTHLYYNGGRYEHYIIEGYYNRTDSIVYFEEVSEVDVNLGMLSDNVMGNYTMKLSTNDTRMRMEGKWRQNTGGLGLMNSKVWLERKLPEPAGKPDHEQKKELVKSQDTSIVKPAVKRPDRDEQIQYKITIPKQETDSIVLEIKDDARIDNDRISLYLDEQVLLQDVRISEEIITLPLHLSKQDHKIIMVAESLGGMPPCTAQVTVITRNMREILKLAGDRKINAVIKLSVE